VCCGASCIEQIAVFAAAAAAVVNVRRLCPTDKSGKLRFAAVMHCALRGPLFLLWLLLLLLLLLSMSGGCAPQISLASVALLL
jgi:hypothetical protein